MSRKNELIAELEECRSKLRDNTRVIDPATRQILLDTIRTDKAELADIDSKERAPKRIIVTVDAPTGNSIITRTNSNNKRIIGSADNIIRVGIR